MMTWQDRGLSDDNPFSGEEQDHHIRLRENLLAAIITVTLVVTGAWLTDELTEDSQGCYRPDGGCEAWGVPIDQIGFDNFLQQ
jgi:hypothetical protein